MTFVSNALSAVALASIGALASAGTLGINPPLTMVNVGDTFDVAVLGTGFAETVVGGGFNLSFDPTVLQFTGGSIAAHWEFLPAIGAVNPVSANVSTLTDASFATFVNSLSGNFDVATLSFTALQAGSSALTLAPSTAFDFSDLDGNPIAPTFNGGQVVVSVPEPASLAMMLAGGLLLAAALRRRRA